MTFDARNFRWLASTAVVLATTAGAQAAPTVKDALSLSPVQRDVQIERPEGAELEKCTVVADGKRGWIVKDSSGQTLRMFIDTNGDNVVDQWSYYNDGIEVYRDIDTNNNKKPDQCRWLNTGGSRWGIDANEDGKIDYWKSISPEEVTSELVAALRERDRARFERILLTSAELKALGVGPAKEKQLQKTIEMALGNFAKMSSGQTLVGKDSKWLSFGAMQPGIVPAGTDESTADLTVYENVMVMIDTDGKVQPITVGALVRVKDTWRLIDLPQMSETAGAHVFFPQPRADRGEGALAGTPGKPNEAVQKLMDDLNKLGEISPSSKPEEHEKREQLLKQLADLAESAEVRQQWLRQMADSLSAAVATCNWEPGVEKLKSLAESLKEGVKEKPEDDELAFYVQWRWMTTDHNHKLSTVPIDQFAKIQEQWTEDLQKFVEAGKKYPDSADAMHELAVTKELGGSEEDAIKWYDTVVREFPDSPVTKKSAGAKLRLTSVGKSIPLKGKLVNGQVYDLERLKNKAVLIQYWATWSPGKAEMPLLKELKTKYKDFEVVGVCLDVDKQAMLEFLKQNDPKWPQLFEEGGLESRFATELGIQTLPTMILVDKQGKVVNRNIRSEEIENELKRVLK